MAGSFEGIASACVAGALGALASVAGKLAFGDSLDALILRTLAGVVMLGLNALMMSFYVRSLRLSPSTVAAIAVNSALNFICSGLLGRTFFGEVLPLRWWLGMLLIIGGVSLVHSGCSAEGTQRKDHGD